jgi:Co/Zn/Cd efflux system component/copper chaperone CopZ
MTTASPPDALRYRITGMDCPSCVAKIEGAARKVPGVKDVRVSLTSQLMTLQVDDPASRLPEVERTISDLGYKLDRVQFARDDDDRLQDYTHTTPAYRRALWIVVLLNVGMGLAEIVAGFVGQSQALKADALDFLGDGTITLLGLIAIGWPIVWRARAAFLQGLFLGVLGIGVLAATAYRVVVLNEPEAEIMGLFGIMATLVNIAAALVLIPHRAGDANVRAVWLFSRNDAIGNVAVVIAAGLVAWTGTPWPDLAVAAVIAGLFLQSSWSILKDARAELRGAN